MAHVTANVANPVPASGQMDSTHLQQLLQQLQAYVNPSQSVNPQQLSTVNENGYMAPQSTSGIISFPTTSLHFQNNILTFQHQCFSSLSSTLPPNAWIIDSGATTHVCSDLSLFSNTSPVTGVTVSLPNGISEHISHIRTVHLSPSLVLHNVLHVPSFRFNLISVCSLLRDNNLSAHCELQESTRDSMIGRGILLHNLYILENVDTSASLAFCGSLQADVHIWHQRLRHLSSSKLKLISGILHVAASSLQHSDHCSVCPQAKQKRLSFVLNSRLSDCPFDSIHLDVWGPFSV